MFWRKLIARLELFGSVLRESFHEDSDVNFLVTFAPENHWSLFDLVTMEAELAGIIGREVDLVSRKGIEQSRNPLRFKRPCQFWNEEEGLLELESRRRSSRWNTLWPHPRAQH